MKRKILLYFCGVGGISILLTMFLSCILFYGLFQKQVREDLRAAAQLASYSDVSGETRWIMRDEVYGIRVTLIAPDGTVLFETDGNADEMENHLGRPEVADALEAGQGQAVRNSATLGKDTFYYAVRLTDGNILRLAKDAHNIMSVFLGAFPGIFFVVAFVFGVAVIVTGKLTRRIVAPIEDMVGKLESSEFFPKYDELVPLMRAMKARDDSIHAQMERLELQQHQINLISGSMNEGLILLDNEKNVLLANASAVRMLGSGGDFIGKSLYYLTRNENLITSAAKALKGENHSVELFCGNECIQAFSNPVYFESEIVGVMCLLLDVTERKQSEKMRREFTANVSHELKTPLTSICGYAELLANGSVNSSDTAEFGGKIYRESMRLLNLITDIIKLSELDGAPPDPEFSDCQLLELARNCSTELKPVAESLNISLEADGENCVIKGSREMLEQLIRNLVDNGIRYNKPGGNVDVTVRKQNDAVVLSVRDTGIGIPAEHQARVFERFYRVDKSRSKATGGTGLGLAIVKHIAEYHGAKITLLSGENGTEIMVAFPLAK